jgi:hypothetical protein
MSLFNNDLYAESVLGKFLDEYFYPNIKIKNFKRVEDKNLQFKGYDVVFECGNQEYIVDEKGYLSRPKIQNTFVLELSYLNRERRKKLGWLLDKNKLSTHYLLCWADRDDVKLNDLKIDNIKLVEAWIINRGRLLNYIDTCYKINEDNISEKVRELEEKAKGGPYQLSNNSRIMQSNQLDEKPLNIVMTKEDYIKSGSVEGKYKINQDGVTYLE